ncbi:sialidase family protein [Actinopolymorpha sp. B9G3]|uniref:WD40/YVTN/BNR-like repeat-containing protein n=1 Tax=Actinopolymorpha sp. B9G3 TaxID=3158970 RepID=UPI0032D8F679
MAERSPWRQLPDIELTTPVLALAADGDRLWIGGVGGLARLDGGPGPSSGGDLGTRAVPHADAVPGIATALTSVAAICRSGSWLVAGGAEGIVRHRDGEAELADVQGSGAPVAALVAIPPVGDGERQEDTGFLLAGTLGDGVLRSLDRGRSWAPATFGLDDHEVSTLCVGPGGTVLAGTADGIFTATTSVKAWRRSAGTQGVAVAAIAYADVTGTPGGVLAAASESGQTFTSRDGGRTWTPGGRVDGQVTAVVALDDGTLLVGTTDAGLWRSVDAGATWTAAADDGGSARTVLCLAVHNGAVYAGTAGGLVTSADAGATWRPAHAAPTHDLDRLLLVNGRPAVGGARSGVVRPEASAGEGATWSALADTPFPLTALAVAPDGALVASGPAGLCRNAGGDAAWTAVVAGEDGHAGVLSFRPDGFGLAAPARHGNHLLRTTDSGVSWQSVPAPFGVLPLVVLQVTAGIVLAATRDPRMGAIQLWASTDEGASWAREVRAETPWPLVRSVADPPLVSLGRTLCARDQHGHWSTWAELDEGIRAVAGGREGLAVLTRTAIWSVAATGEVGVRWDEGLPVADVLDIALSQGRLHALLTGGRVWWRDVKLRARPADEHDEPGATWPELHDHTSTKR